MTSEPESGPMPARLQTALLSLDKGELVTTRQTVLGVLADAEARQDRVLEANALLALAHCDRFAGRFRKAHEAAQRATRMFQMQGNTAGEVDALTVLAQCAVNLGHDEEAVEAALLSVKLGEALPGTLHRIASLNYLGLAYLWSKAFALADASLQAAAALGRELGAGHSWQPLAGMAWVEVVRLAKTRFLAGTMPAVDELQRRAELCQQVLMEELPMSVMPGAAKALAPLARMTHALACCWSGQPDKALAELRRTPGVAASSARVVDVVERWVHAEACWQLGELDLAEQHACRAIELADQTEYEQLAGLLHLVRAQVLEQQGRADLALAELRRLRQREMRIRTERLESRHWVVQTALDMRNNEESLAQMARYSKELERLSFEDPLTGLANRRRFQQQLETQLAHGVQAAEAVCVALIDLDDFKRVNDAHTHSVGDEVLKGVAEALRSCVREGDLPARLAGDEFVVLFPGTALAEAQRVCSRIQDTVAQLRWPHLHPELQVQVTVGVAQTEPGETPAELLHRSDVAMFANK